jgi:hypothetical protein
MGSRTGIMSLDKEIRMRMEGKYLILIINSDAYLGKMKI